MKIFYLYDSIARTGGLERIFVNKMNYLVNNTEYEIYLVTAIQGNHPFVYPLSSKIKHIDLNVRFHQKVQYRYPYRIWIKYKSNQLYRRRLQDIVSKINPDIIITPTNWFPDFTCKLRTNASIIIESHSAKNYTWRSAEYRIGNIRELYYQYIGNKRSNYAEKHCTALVTITQKDAESWKHAPMLRVIPNMITPPSIESSTCDIPRVIAAGRLTYQKGFDLLIEAWRTVQSRHPEWKLSIYGEGPYEQILSEKIHQYKLEEQITIHPFTSNIFQEYVNSSIYVLSSRYEGFGLVLAEAMSVGLPCVSFDCPYGPSEIIKHEEDGLLVKNGDIIGLADSICRLIENKEERKAFGKKAKQNVTRFFPENIMPQWEQLFKELTNK